MRARIEARSRAYCSSDNRSAGVSRAAISDSVGNSQQTQGWRGFARALGKPALNLVPRHRAVARIIVRLTVHHFLPHRTPDLHGGVAEFALDRVGAVMPGTAFDHIDRGAGYQPQHVA